MNMKFFKISFVSSIMAIAFASCSGQVNKTQNLDAQKIAAQTADACAQNMCPCSYPGGTVASGSQVSVYDASVVNCGDTCAPHMSQVTCTNGKFSKDVSALSFSCQVGSCTACSLGNNLISNNAQVTTYKVNQLDCGQSCEDFKLVRTCANGVLSGDPAYQYTTCQPSTCSCRLPDNSGSLTLGGSMNFYSTQNAACGVSCASQMQSRTCGSTGTGSGRVFSFSGSASYQYTSCKDADPSTCQCTLPNGLGTLGNGGTFVLNTLQTATCQTCAQLGQALTVKCTGGVLQDPSLNTINIATTPYKYLCTQSACVDCVLPGFAPGVGDGKSIYLYTHATYDCGVSPSLDAHSFACSAGKLTRDGSPYDPTKDPSAPSAYYTNSTSSCVGCTTPWGATISVGTNVKAYRFSGAVVDGCGKSCSYTTLTCVSQATLTGDTSYTMSSCQTACNTTGGGAPPKACLLPWQNSFVTPDSLVPMWSKKTVTCGDSCQNYFKLGKCSLSTGTFDAGLKYIYPSCTELCP